MFYNNKKETQRNSKENFWPAVDWTYFFLPRYETKSSHVSLMDIHHYFFPNWRHISFSWSLDFLQVLQENVAAIGACCCMSPPAGKHQLRVSVLIAQLNQRRQGLLSSLIETDRWPQTEHMLFKQIFGLECIYSDQACLYNMQSGSCKPLLRQRVLNKGEKMQLHRNGYRSGKMFTDSPGSQTWMC